MNLLIKLFNNETRQFSKIKTFIIHSKLSCLFVYHHGCFKFIWCSHNVLVVIFQPFQSSYMSTIIRLAKFLVTTRFIFYNNWNPWLFFNYFYFFSHKLWASSAYASHHQFLLNTQCRSFSIQSRTLDNRRKHWTLSLKSFYVNIEMVDIIWKFSKKRNKTRQTRS